MFFACEFLEMVINKMNWVAQILCIVSFRLEGLFILIFCFFSQVSRYSGALQSTSKNAVVIEFILGNLYCFYVLWLYISNTSKDTTHKFQLENKICHNIRLYCSYAESSNKLSAPTFCIIFIYFTIFQCLYITSSSIHLQLRTKTAKKMLSLRVFFWPLLTRTRERRRTTKLVLLFSRGLY